MPSSMVVRAKLEPALVGSERTLGRIAVADSVMERIRCRDDHRVLCERRELFDAGQPLGMATREERIPLDHLGRPRDTTPPDLRIPEVPEADQRVVVAPFRTTVDAGALDAPERPGRGILAGRDARPRVLHLVGERMEHADDDHAVGTTVETAVHDGRDLMPAVEHARVREHDDTSGCERRGEIPLTRALQPLQRPSLAHRLVLRAVELVNLLLQPSPVEAHRFCAAGLNVYAFSAPIPTPYNTITIPSSSDVAPDTRP